MTSGETIQGTNRPPSTLVWDPLVRLGHWALVAAFAMAYFSAEEEAGGPDPWPNDCPTGGSDRRTPGYALPRAGRCRKFRSRAT